MAALHKQTFTMVDLHSNLLNVIHHACVVMKQYYKDNLYCVHITFFIVKPLKTSTTNSYGWGGVWRRKSYSLPKNKMSEQN